jgi:hypothetical protein
MCSEPLRRASNRIVKNDSRPTLSEFMRALLSETFHYRRASSAFEANVPQYTTKVEQYVQRTETISYV